MAAAGAVQALPIIDEFDAPVGGQSLSLANPTAGDSVSDSKTGLAGVAGGSRDLTLTVQDVFAGGSQVTAEINLATSPGNFQLLNSIRVDSLVTIGWDADGAGLNLDLSAFTSLALEGVENDLSTTYKLIVATSGGGSSELTLPATAGFTGSLDFAFASFVGTANLADVDSIVLEIDGARGADVIIDRLVAVPEPTTAAALGLGLAGLAWMGGRRRAS
jgi:hypothetical protein